jgi:dihydroflavonol-4-reductase
MQAEHLGRNGARYILSGHWRSLLDIARITSEYTGNSGPQLAVPIWLAQLFQPIMARLAQINNSQPLYTKSMLGTMRSNRQIDHTRATRDLGYAPRPFEETMTDTLDWFSKQRGQA